MRLGDWGDIKALTEVVDVMGDVIVNHMSSESPQFLDYSRKGAASKYDGLFLTMDAVFPDGATEKDLLAVYRPRPGMPFTMTTLANGDVLVSSGVTKLVKPIYPEPLDNGM